MLIFRFFLGFWLCFARWFVLADRGYGSGSGTGSGSGKARAKVDSTASSTADHRGAAGRPLNILVILADDLGYGDTSVAPFQGSGIHTPALEKMAARGTIMTNFHTAAPTCTPTRASILTGLFPWRLGIKAVFEYGEKGKSNRDDWLAQVPTVAMAFRSANYTTGHSGKWHVGGMRNDDYEMRMQPDRGMDPATGLPPTGGSKRCPHPGPNQQGFAEYVSVLDGPGAVRQNELQVNANLYSEGCHHLLRNDKPLGANGFISADDAPLPMQGGSKEYLFDCEARHAIRMMRASVAAKSPFFVQVWFHAPHGPWEELSDFRAPYRTQPGHRTHLMRKYQTMVTGMDRAVGTLLTAIDQLGIEKDTLVVFLSDNGPENDVGTTGWPWNTTAGFRGNKRFLYEGGIRVPCIWQWVGTIPAGKASSALGISTDLFPTFLEAAQLAKSVHLNLDGMSLLPELVPHFKRKREQRWRAKRRAIAERMGIWHTAYEGPRSSAGILFDFKVMLDTKDQPSEIFDLSVDPFERNNLIPDLKKASADTLHSWATLYELQSTVFNHVLHQKMDLAFLNNSSTTTLNSYANVTVSGKKISVSDRRDPALHRYIVAKVYKRLKDFADYGNEAHRIYLGDNAGRQYVPTVESDQRYVNGANIYRKTNRAAAKKIRQDTIERGTCSTPCSCNVPSLPNVPPLPFDRVTPDRGRYIIPTGFINATQVLFTSSPIQEVFQSPPSLLLKQKQNGGGSSSSHSTLKSNSNSSRRKINRIPIRM